VAQTWQRLRYSCLETQWLRPGSGWDTLVWRHSGS